MNDGPNYVRKVRRYEAWFGVSQRDADRHTGSPDAITDDLNLIRSVLDETSRDGGFRFVSVLDTTSGLLLSWAEFMPGVPMPKPRLWETLMGLVP